MTRTPAAEQVMRATDTDGSSLSDRANAVLRRYQRMVEMACPELTVTEWFAVCTYLQLRTDKYQAIPIIWRSMPEISQLAAREVADRFWSRYDPSQPLTPALTLAGAKIRA